MTKIEKLTKEQEMHLPIFREEYLMAATSSRRIDCSNLESAIEEAYAVIGKKKPTLIILQSPRQAMMAIKFMKNVFAIKDKERQCNQCRASHGVHQSVLRINRKKGHPMIKTRWFSFLLFLARVGFFRHEGLVGRIPFFCPTGRVVYADGARSIKMPLGNAVDYQRLFGGKVVRK